MLFAPLSLVIYLVFDKYTTESADENTAMDTVSQSSEILDMEYPCLCDVVRLRHTSLSSWGT